MHKYDGREIKCILTGSTFVVQTIEQNMMKCNRQQLKRVQLIKIIYSMIGHLFHCRLLHVIQMNMLSSWLITECNTKCSYWQIRFWKETYSNISQWGYCYACASNFYQVSTKMWFCGLVYLYGQIGLHSNYWLPSYP